MTESHTQSILTNPAKWSPQCSGLGVQGGERRRLQDELPHDTAHDASTRGSTAPYAAERGFLNPDDQSSTEFGSCVKVEVAVLGLMSLMVSVDVKHR